MADEEQAAFPDEMPEEAREYDRFIELGDIIATLRLKAERQLQFARG